nr:MAG TPA: hypothetical protein [Caudoviricetes sp.]
METPGCYMYGNSTYNIRASPTLLVIGEMFNKHVTNKATRTKINSIRK